MCADILVGNEMVRGISGGQKKRVTTGMGSFCLIIVGCFHGIHPFFIVST